MKNLRPCEIAKIKKVKTQSVYRWIREGIIPKDKIVYVKKTVKRISVRGSVLEEELKDYPKDNSK